MDLKSVIASVKSLAVIRKGGLPLAHLNREYREMIGESLNFRQFGFNTLEALLTSVPEIRIKSSHEGPVLVVNDEKISHVADLVSRQAAKKTSRKKPKSRNGAYMQRSNYQYQRHQFNSAPYSSKSQPFQVRRFDSGGRHNQPLRSQSQLQARPPPGPPFRQQSASQSKSLQSRSVSQTRHHIDSYDSWSSASDDTWDCPSSKPPVQSSRLVLAPKTSAPSLNRVTSSDNSVKPAAGKQCNTQRTLQKNFDSNMRTKTQNLDNKACSFGVGDVRFSSKTNSSVPIIQSQTQVKIKQEPVSEDTQAEQTVLPSHGGCDLNAESGKAISSTDFYRERFNDSFFPLPLAFGRGRGRALLGSSLNVKPGGLGTSSCGDERVGSDTGASSNKYDPNAADDLTQCGTPVKRMKADVLYVSPGPNINRVSQVTSSGTFTSITVTIPNSPTEAASDWGEEFDPSICDYQLLGDDFLLRLSEVSLDSYVYSEGGVKRCGLCVANQTIDECLSRIESGESVADQVIVMLGLTDILHGHSLSEVKNSMQALLLALRKKGKSIMVLTLPELPSLVQFPKVFSTLQLFNSWLLSMKSTVLNLWIEDINPHLYGENEKPYPGFYKSVYGGTDIWTDDGCWAVMDAICSKML